MIAIEAEFLLTRLIFRHGYSSRPLLALVSILFLRAPVIAEPTVSLIARFSTVDGGSLHCFLVDEKRFGTVMTGIESWVIPVRGTPQAPQVIGIPCRVPAGVYGLRAFLDTNGNGLLDRGILGPSEPWGMSWRWARPAGFPRFKDISFEVSVDCQSPIVEVK